MTDPSQNPWRIGLQAARANLVPGLVLQAAAITLGVAYAACPAFRALLGHVALWQAEYGAPFATLSRMTFSGIIPFAVCLAMPSVRPRHPLPDLVLNLVLWSLVGLVTYYFYALQCVLYGSGHAPLTVAAKMLTDLLLFTPAFPAPLAALVYLWKDNDYAWERLRRQLRPPGLYRRLILPTLIPNWAVWTPAVLVIYCLPLPLQVHVGALIGCFWSLMCLHIASQVNRRAPARSA